MEPPKPVINIYGSERTILNESFSSLKLECEKLAQEKTEIQRQYIMVSICVCICVFVCLYLIIRGNALW